MFSIISGGRKEVKEKIEHIATAYKLPIVYAPNIYKFLSMNYGLFFKPSLVYFIYDNKDFDKDSLISFNKLITKSKCYVVCIIETTLDKRSAFYKQYGKQIKYLGGHKQDINLTQKVYNFYNDARDIQNISDKEAVSFLYKIFYDFKNPKYKEEAGECINLVLTGRINTEQILKVFLLKLLDKKKLL